MPINPYFCLILTIGILVAFTVFTVMFIIKNKKRAKRKYPFNYEKNNRFLSILPYLGIVVFVYIFLFHGTICPWKNVDLENNADKIIEISKGGYGFYESSAISDVQVTVLRAEYENGEGIGDYENYFVPDINLLENLYRTHLVSEIEKNGYKIVVNSFYGQSILGLLKTGMYSSEIFVFSDTGYSVIEIDCPMKFTILQPIMMTHPKCDDLPQHLF